LLFRLVADPSAEARIRDLKRRVELEPNSRLFLALAEEYRKNGQLPSALSTLQKGLLAHPSYLSAHVALGRAYLESGQITEAIATFSKVLANDPGNLVSARSLADIYLSRGESVEAIKKYKLYRALSGDRTVDETIERLDLDLAPPPPSSDARGATPPPPPPTFYEGKTGPIRTSREMRYSNSVLAGAPPSEDSDVTVKFEPDDSTASGRAPTEPMPISRDIPLIMPSVKPPVAAPPVEEDVTTRAFQIGDVLDSPPEPSAPTAEPEPQGRVLADLYFAQGHYTEALRIYDELVAASPFDADLKRMRREAEARLLPAASPPGTEGASGALERRLAKVRALKRWLAVVQTG
jgi:tetratricopeptide (TPR) repeat protein